MLPCVSIVFKSIFFTRMINKLSWIEVWIRPKTATVSHNHEAEKTGIAEILRWLLVTLLSFFWLMSVLRIFMSSDTDTVAMFWIFPLLDAISAKRDGIFTHSPFVMSFGKNILFGSGTMAFFQIVDSLVAKWLLVVAKIHSGSRKRRVDFESLVKKSNHLVITSSYSS